MKILANIVTIILLTGVLSACYTAAVAAAGAGGGYIYAKDKQEKKEGK